MQYRISEIQRETIPERAEAIKEVMVKKFKIDAARIKAKGYGLSKPIASNATKEGRQQNRRVEAAVEYMIKKSEPVAAPQAGCTREAGRTGSGRPTGGS